MPRPIRKGTAQIARARVASRPMPRPISNCTPQIPRARFASRPMPLGRATRDLILREQEYRCILCDMEKDLRVFQLDHIVPISQGGANTRDNLQVVCGDCHCIKTHENRCDRQSIKYSGDDRLYDAIRIIRATKSEYLVEWAPTNGKKFANSWICKDNANQELVDSFTGTVAKCKRR